MRTKILKTLLFLLAPVLSGVLLVLSFSAYDLGWLAWIAFVPILLVIIHTNLMRSWLLFWLFGMIFFVGNFNWIFEIAGYRLFHHFLLIPYMGSYFGIFGFVFSIILKRAGINSALFSAPFVWVSLEFVRANFFFLANPWAFLAHSQYKYLPIIQIASFAGTYSLSFLIILVNATLAAATLTYLFPLKGLKQSASNLPSHLTTIHLILVTVVLTLPSFIYGYIKVSKPIVGKAYKVSVVQGNIQQSKKWDPRFAESIMQTYAELTREASMDQPALIIWPEAATPGSISQDPKVYSKVRQIAKTAGTYLLIGSTQHQKFQMKKRRKIKYRNSAHLIHPGRGSMRQRYDKMLLFPFSEYLPYKERLPWSWVNVPTNIGGYIPGEKFTVFELSSFRFSTPICWENIFPNLVRQFVKGGAQFIVNITNEARFGQSLAPYQFVAMSVFRAVENRVYVVRSANTGISCFIDPHGKVINRVKDKNGQDIFVRGVLTETVIPMKAKTIYTMYGDWLIWLSIFFSVGFLTVALLKKPNRN